MKKIIVTVLLLVSSYSVSAQDWTQLNVSGSTSLHGCSISPTETKNVWFVGYYFNAAFDFISFCYNTTDGGSTFNYQTLNFNGMLKAEDVYFKDNNTGIIVGMGIVKTYDGGVNWIPSVDGISMRGTANDLYWSGNDVYAVGQRYDFGYQFYEGFIYKSNDGGINYTDYTISSDTSMQNSDVRAIFSTGNGVCYAGAINNTGTSNTLFKSTDDGTTWNELNFTNSINSLFFTSAQNGFAATDIGIFSTTDAGQTWTNILSTTQSLNSIKINNQFGLAVGDGGLIYKTTDGGTSWLQMTSPVTFPLHKVSIISSSLAYATGPGGAIKYVNITDVTDQSNLVHNFKLNQNYPNPFNPTTTINYELSNAGNVSLVVYDVIGNEVATLVNEEKSAGSYKVDFNASTLSSDIYFYKLKAGTLVETKKMILMK